MDCLGGRVSIERTKEDYASVQIVTRANFYRLLCSVAVAYENHVVLKGADLDGAPGNALDHASVLLLSNHDYVADLKWPVRMQRNTGEKISQSVLAGETDDKPEDG